MHIVEEKEFCEKAYPFLDKVFTITVDQRYHFSKSISSRIIVYDTFSDSIDDAVPMKIIIAAARAVGDKGCYFHLPYPSIREPDFYYVPFNELEEAYYSNINNNDCLSKENSKKIAEWAYRYPIFGGRGCTIIYSENAQWGIKTSMCSSWGLVGGIDAFVSGLKQGLPDLEKQVFSFLFDFYVDCYFDKTNYLEQMISAGIRTDLEHVYGIQKTEEMLKMTVEELFENSAIKGKISDYI